MYTKHVMQGKKVQLTSNDDDKQEKEETYILDSPHSHEKASVRSSRS